MTKEEITSEALEAFLLDLAICSRGSSFQLLSWDWRNGLWYQLLEILGGWINISYNRSIMSVKIFPQLNQNIRSRTKIILLMKIMWTQILLYKYSGSNLYNKISNFFKAPILNEDFNPLRLQCKQTLPIYFKKFTTTLLQDVIQKALQSLLQRCFYNAPRSLQESSQGLSTTAFKSTQRLQVCFKDYQGLSTLGLLQR